MQLVVSVVSQPPQLVIRPVLMAAKLRIHQLVRSRQPMTDKICHVIAVYIA